MKKKRERSEEKEEKSTGCLVRAPYKSVELMKRVKDKWREKQQQLNDFNDKLPERIRIADL